MTAYTNYKLSYGVTSCFGVNEGMSAEQPTTGLDLPRFIYFFVLGSLCYVNIYLVFSILQRVRNMFRQYGGGAGKISYSNKIAYVRKNSYPCFHNIPNQHPIWWNSPPPVIIS